MFIVPNSRTAPGRVLIAAALLLPGFILLSRIAYAQCIGEVSTPRSASDCAAHSAPAGDLRKLDTSHVYTLAELIDIAESNNPYARMAWESAKQKANELGIARSAYFPVLAGMAAIADQRVINPFPKPLAPRGYVMVEAPVVEPELKLQYLIYDFGKREARVDAATAAKLAAGAHFIQANQEVAFRVSGAFYKLQTVEQRLTAASETLKTAQTTQEAAEARLNNGKATLPDVLNARAESAQALFDLASAEGEVKVARVALTEALGVEPTPEISIVTSMGEVLPLLLSVSITELLDRALQDRPDLLAQAQSIRMASDGVKASKAEYKPRIALAASGVQTSIWPSADFGKLGSTSQATWSTTLAVEWRIFDGGARRGELAVAESKRREAEDAMRARQDDAVREVWTAYIGFQTAVTKEQAAVCVLDSTTVSYSASLDAYKYGVRNLIDVVTAENRLAQARLAGVAARSQLLLEAVNLEFVTGNLLRNRPTATQVSTESGVSK